MIVFPNVGAIQALNQFLTRVDPWFHLFVNLVTLGPTTTLADLVEPDWTDYAAVEVTTWTSAIISNGVALSAADPQTWTRGTGGSADQVVGYFVTDGQFGPLMWAEARPAGPVPMVQPTDQVLIQPTLTLTQST